MSAYGKGFSWSLVYSVFTKIATPVIALVVFRLLGPETMNSYLLITNVMLFAELFRDSGVARMYLNEKDVDEGVDRAYGTLSIGVSVLMAVALILAGPLMAARFHAPELVGGFAFAAVGVLLNGVSTLPASKLLREARLKEVGFAEAMGSVLSSAWALVFVFCGFGFWALASQIVVRSVIYLGLVYRSAPCRMIGYDRAVYRRIAGSSWLLTGINLMWVGFSTLDQLIVAGMLGNRAGGNYGTGKLMVSSADVLAKPLTQTSRVAFARGQDEAQIRRTLDKSLLIFLIVVVPIYACVAILARPLIETLLGPKYAGTVEVVPILCLYYAAVYPGSFASEALLMAGKPQVALIGWIVNYAYLGAMLATVGRHAELPALALVFTSGLTLVNASTLVFAMRRFPPDPRARENAARAFLALAVTVVAAVGCLALPGRLPPLVAAFLAIPLIHAVALSTVFLRAPASIFSKTGVKALWNRL